MPQLDFLTYFYQYNWLLITFLVFYFYSLKEIFPSISTALKARTKKTLRDRVDLYNIEREENHSLKEYEELWEKVLKIREKQAQQILVIKTKKSCDQFTYIK